MGKAYKNFWSLNTDEAVVTGILRDETKRDIEVFMPLNAQMKDVDLVLMNMKNTKTITIQVKGSKAYEPRKSEVKKFGKGSSGWFYFDKKIIHNSTAKYFIFLVYVLKEVKEKGRRVIEPHTITIPTKEIRDLCKKNKIPHGKRYSFYFWVNPDTKKAFDFRDNLYHVDDYLDKRGFEKLNKELE